MPRSDTLKLVQSFLQAKYPKIGKKFAKEVKLNGEAAGSSSATDSNELLEAVGFHLKKLAALAAQPAASDSDSDSDDSRYAIQRLTAIGLESYGSVTVWTNKLNLLLRQHPLYRSLYLRRARTRRRAKQLKNLQ